MRPSRIDWCVSTSTQPRCVSSHTTTSQRRNAQPPRTSTSHSRWSSSAKRSPTLFATPFDRKAKDGEDPEKGHPPPPPRGKPTPRDGAGDPGARADDFPRATELVEELRPLLLRGGRKFDVRCWVLLDPDYKVYLYREGVLRTGAVAYSVTVSQRAFIAG